MGKFVIPALDLMYRRLQKGLTTGQLLCAAVLAIILLVNFMFRAGCPAERRFLVSQVTHAVAVCATPAMVGAPDPRRQQASRSTSSTGSSSPRHEPTLAATSP
jgi:hypothetical protein